MGNKLKNLKINLDELEFMCNSIRDIDQILKSESIAAHQDSQDQEKQTLEKIKKILT